MSYSEKYAEQNKEAVRNVLDFFNNNATQAAKYFGLSIPSISSWRKRGRISKKIAIMIDEDQKLPFTKQEIRSDILVW